MAKEIHISQTLLADMSTTKYWDRNFLTVKGMTRNDAQARVHYNFVDAEWDGPRLIDLQVPTDEDAISVMERKIRMTKFYIMNLFRNSMRDELVKWSQQKKVYDTKGQLFTKFSQIRIWVMTNGKDIWEEALKSITYNGMFQNMSSYATAKQQEFMSTHNIQYRGKSHLRVSGSKQERVSCIHALVVEAKGQLIKALHRPMKIVHEVVLKKRSDKAPTDETGKRKRVASKNEVQLIKVVKRSAAPSQENILPARAKNVLMMLKGKIMDGTIQIDAVENLVKGMTSKYVCSKLIRTLSLLTFAPSLEP